MRLIFSFCFMVSFYKNKFLVLVPNFLSIFYNLCFFGGLSKKLFPAQRSQRTPFILLSKTFTVFPVIYMYLYLLFKALQIALKGYIGKRLTSAISKEWTD